MYNVCSLTDVGSREREEEYITNKYQIRYILSPGGHVLNT